MIDSFLEIIHKKRDGQVLTQREVDFLVKGYTKGAIPDYQFSAFLMAIYFQGMNFNEICNLTKAMLYSGEVLDLSDIKIPKVDKHSTGGVGDKVSLILAPLVASCGVCVPMISGRSLGHTGGTLDKLESIPGFRTDLSLKDFKTQLKEIGVAMIGQTEEIAPADRKIYGLRDVTATVDSIPLIAASIMSKKLAEDLNGLVIDVKFGSGAFMKEYSKAKALASTLVNVGKNFGVKTVGILTNMNNPLGEYVGNSLEVMETIECLKGKGSKDLMNITLALGEMMLKIAKTKDAKKLLLKKIYNGEALNKFKEMIMSQGGDAGVINDYSKLPIAKNRIKYLAPKTGYIHKIDTFNLGMLCTKLGAGRLKKDDCIDPGCGFRIYRKSGDFVKKSEPLIEIFSDDKTKALEVFKAIPQIFLQRQKPVKKGRLIRELIN